MISLMWLTYNKENCDEVSSFPALVAHTENFCDSPAQSFAGGMLGNFQEPKPVYFLFTHENTTFGSPSLPDVTNPQDSKKHFWWTVFSKGFQAHKKQRGFGVFFKQYEETVSHETAVPSNFNSIVFSQVEHDCDTSMWFLGNMAQSTEGTKTCFPAAAGKRSTYFGILTAREHMISNCFFQKN